MKIKKLFARRVTSLLLVCLMAFTMLPTGALAADVTDETTHVHTEDCSHEEVSDISTVVAEETVEPEVQASSGTIGESLVAWAFDTVTGRMTISGSGDCAVFTSAEDQPWAAYRTQIREVWFNDMDALTITDLAYWFDGCTALTIAEIPYTTPVVGTRAFANCSELRTLLIYHDGSFSINEGAFAADELSALEIRYIPSSEATTAVLADYDWKTDNRAVFYEDVYGISLLASGSCHFCGGTYSYTLDYEYWTEDTHAIRHWCSNCGYDQCGGVLGEDHTFSNGVCTKCGYDNGTGSGGGDIGGGDTTCYHYYSTYYSWYGCDYYEYCSDCGEYLGSGTSHGYTYTEWSGCNWYEYCNDCDQLMDSGTSHGSYSYGAWEYYNSSRHRRYYSCSDCGEGSYSYGYHSTTTKYTEYSSTQHKYGSYCSTCSSYVGYTSYANHSFSYGSWTKYSDTQHRRTVSCSTCGYSTYEYASHSLSYGNWTSVSDTQHSRTISCTCGYSTTETASHSLAYGDWEVSEGTYYTSKHQRTVSCSCGYSMTEYEDHSCYGVSDWEYADETYHKRNEECDCGYPRISYTYHSYTTEKESVSDTEHNVVKTCSYCGHSTTESEAHSFIYGAWEDYDDTRHRRTASCDCGYSGYDYAIHVYIDTDSLEVKDDTEHYLIHKCKDCTHFIKQPEEHSFSYGTWYADNETEHSRTVSCRCGYTGEETALHEDLDGDDYCDGCGYLVTRFSVTLPAAMAMTVSEDGEIHTADNAVIVNNSTHAVEITSVTVTAAEDWTLVPYDFNMAAEKVDAKLIGFYLNDTVTSQIGSSESLTLPTNWTIDRDASFALEYDAVVSATSDVLTNEQVLTLVFVINWAPR